MLFRVQQLLMRLELFLAGTALLLLLTLTLGQILARNFFETGLPAADSLSRLLLLYVTFLGAALAIGHDRHIKVDVIAHWLPQYWQGWLFRPLQLLGAIICSAFTLSATRFWLDEWQYAATHERWLVLLNLILPAGFCLLAIQFLLGLLIGRHPEKIRRESERKCSPP